MAYKTVDAHTLKSWLHSGEAVLVDVREPGEHGAKRIANATLLPLGSVSVASLPPACLDKKIVVHCKAGMRSAAACNKLLQENPALDIYNLEGGIDAWERAGLAIEELKKFFLPLDRQVQLTIGLAIVFSIVLGYAVHPGFLVIAVIFGLGLVNAGITGWCGLAMLMAKMPWNACGGEKKSCCPKK